MVERGVVWVLVITSRCLLTGDIGIWESEGRILDVYWQEGLLLGK